MRSTLRLFVHTVIFAHHFFALIALYMMDMDKMEHAKTKYLMDFREILFSGWNFFFDIFFLILALSCDLMKIKYKGYSKMGSTYNAMTNIAACRDFVFNTFVLPFGMFVCLAFWATFTYNRELVMPEEWDAVMTPFINHALHTSPAILIVLELTFSSKRNPESHMYRIAWITFVTFAYYTCFIVAYFVTGIWIYAIFALLGWETRVFLLLMFYLSTIIFYFFGWYTNIIIDSIWKKYHNKK